MVSAKVGLVYLGGNPKLESIDAGGIASKTDNVAV